MAKTVSNDELDRRIAYAEMGEIVKMPRVVAVSIMQELRARRAADAGGKWVAEDDLRAVAKMAAHSGHCDKFPCPVGGQSCEECELWSKDDRCEAALLARFGLEVR